MMAQGGAGGRRPKVVLPRRIIFFHILPRLPVSSLQRCKGVCKQWHSFLKSRFFANMHNRHLTTNGSSWVRPKLLSLPCPEPWSGFKIKDYCSEAGSDDYGSIDDNAEPSWMRHPFPFEPAADAFAIRAVPSVHGLVCVWVEKKNFTSANTTDDTDVMLWNPLTGEYKTLCRTNNHPYNYSRRFYSSLGLYYHAADDDYKLLVISYNLDMQIYSWRSDSWRNVHHSTHNYQTLSHFGPAREGWVLGNGSLLNDGNLYFLHRKMYTSIDRKQRTTATYKATIIKFDTKDEKLSVIPTPSSLLNYINHQCNTKLSMKVEEGGVIYLGVRHGTDYPTTTESSYIQTWRMKGDHGNWEKAGCQYKGLEPFLTALATEVKYTESFMSPFRLRPDNIDLSSTQLKKKNK